MSAIIRFPNGAEAKLVDAAGTWECANEELRMTLEKLTGMLPYYYFPDPIEGIATEVAREAGAEVVYVEKMWSGVGPWERGR
jgi:hypothetical protein